MRRGFSLPELALVLALVGTLAALALPRFGAWRDRHAVDTATREMIAFYEAARFHAIARSRFLRLEFRPDTLLAFYRGATETFAFGRPGPARHGVGLVVTRGSIEIAPTGLGWGGANTKLVVRRGAAGDSLTTSRLGRLKRWD